MFYNYLDLPLDAPSLKATDNGVAMGIIFAHGGYFLTLFYGLIIAIITLGGFLSSPILYLQREGIAVTLSAINTAFEEPNILVHAQTYAFTVLGPAWIVDMTKLTIDTTIENKQ